MDLTGDRLSVNNCYRFDVSIRGNDKFVKFLTQS